MVQRFIKQKEAQASRERCVVVVYENPAIREYAVRFCERVAAEQGCAPMSEVIWWSFQVLGNAVAGRDAAQKAARADMVVFALHARGDLPDGIKWWIESWLNKRGEREGALVGLLVREEAPYHMAPFREIYLRNIALRAGMDYLCHAAPTTPKAIPDSLDSFSERAGQMTSVLDKILHTRPQTPPPML